VPASWQAYSAVPKSFPDGTSTTILVTEKYARCGAGGSLWGRSTPDLWQPTFAAWSREKFQVQPSDSATPCNPRLASTPYAGGINVCLADGSVRSVSPGVSASTWWAACTPAGGEVLGNDW
jgi:prepilin-type processing-associated H-X9-DG protein